MEIEIFKSKFIGIAENIENTNYGSIITQFKLILLIQEFSLTNNFSNNEIIEICSGIVYRDLDFEAQDEAMGEFFTNLQSFHKAKPVVEDFGESYISLLFGILKTCREKNLLSNECNT